MKVLEIETVMRYHLVKEEYLLRVELRCTFGFSVYRDLETETLRKYG